MSNGQIQKRIIPDVTRILAECPKLNVTVALGIDGLKEDHDQIRQKPGSIRGQKRIFHVAKMAQDANLQTILPRRPRIRRRYR